MNTNVPKRIGSHTESDWITRPTSFFEDEGGMETIEKVLTIFVAAIILIALIGFFNNGIFDNVKKKISDFFSKTAT